MTDLKRAIEGIKGMTDEEIVREAEATFEPEFVEEIVEIMRAIRDGTYRPEDEFDEEEESPEELRAQAEAAEKMADWLRSQDAGSLMTVLKRRGMTEEEIEAMFDTEEDKSRGQQ